MSVEIVGESPISHRRDHPIETSAARRQDLARGGAAQSPRREEATMLSAATPIAGCVHLIRAEYLEMPGLHLTKPQVQRLWGLDAMTCEALLSALIDVNFLRRTSRGAYVRAEVG